MAKAKALKVSEHKTHGLYVEKFAALDAYYIATIDLGDNGLVAVKPENGDKKWTVERVGDEQTILTNIGVFRPRGSEVSKKQFKKNMRAILELHEESIVFHDEIDKTGAIFFGVTGDELDNSSFKTKAKAIETIENAEADTMAYLRRAHKKGLLKGTGLIIQGPKFLD